MHKRRRRKKRSLEFISNYNLLSVIFFSLRLNSSLVPVNASSSAVVVGG
jgi:hypothetical protein